MNAINILLSVTKPSMPWEWLIIDVLDFIPNYGLRVLFLIVMLKLVLFPLDFYQRKLTVDNARKMEHMKPKLDELEMQFGHDRAMLAQKQRALHKQEKYNPMGACLPAIVTLVIFITLFSSFRICSNYYNALMAEQTYQAYASKTIVTVDRPEIDMTLEELQEILDEMYQKEVELGTNPDPLKYQAEPADLTKNMGDEGTGRGPIGEAKKYAGQLAALEVYESEFEPLMKFLFVANVCQPDIWVDPIPTYKNITDSLGASKGVQDSENVKMQFDVYIDLVREEYNIRWNGFFVYIILAVGLNFLQQFITSRQQKKANPSGDQASNAMGGMGAGKMMMFMMPVMMGVFGFIQPASFTIYIVVNSAMGILINLLSGFIIKLFDSRKEAKAAAEVQSTGVRSLRGLSPKAPAKPSKDDKNDKK